MDYFLSIDQGTTSTRCILFDQDGNIKNSHQIELTQYFPDNKSVEHDPIEIWESVTNCISKVDEEFSICLLYTSPSPRDLRASRMPSSA